MVQFKIISGSRAGTIQVGNQFPLTIGRAAGSVIRLEDSGVWDTHLRLELDAERNFVLQLQPNAIASVNGKPFDRIVLRNGDLIELGAVKIQFWLGETRQQGLKLREAVMWIGLVLVTVIEIGFIFWLMQ